MNAQKPGIEWTHPYGRPGFTWNVPGGCFHDCKWSMPDGKIARCYAGDVAEGIATNAYPLGFQHHYWNPQRLNEPLKQTEPAGIFLDSMSDLMGHWVPDDHIHQVLDVCARASQHIFFLLTKNAPRLLKFDFPPNVWVGASMPPDYFMGKQLTHDQQERMLSRTLEVLAEVHAALTWISFEPLSWDVAPLMSDPPINWAVIGAASRGRDYFQPDPRHVDNLLQVLDAHEIPVFFKGNLQAATRREEYPEVVSISVTKG